MTRRRVASRLPRVLLVAALTAATAPAQPLTEATCSATRDAVLPAGEDLAWTAVPWRTTLATAAIEADDADRPVLLWAMNGHPLGAT